MSLWRALALVSESVDLTSRRISSMALERKVDSPMSWRRRPLIRSSSVRWKRFSMREDPAMGFGLIFEEAKFQFNERKMTMEKIGVLVGVLMGLFEFHGYTLGGGLGFWEIGIEIEIEIW